MAQKQQSHPYQGWLACEVLEAPSQVPHATKAAQTQFLISRSVRPNLAPLIAALAFGGGRA
jgi:hypothetical protein